MGNSASNANNPSRNATGSSNRNSSISPGPGNPHKSMKNRKKSLELPDLAALSLTPVTPYTATSTTAAIDVNRGRVPTKTASIPIPTLPPSPFNHYQLAQAVPEDDDDDDDLDDDFGGGGTGRGAHRRRRRAGRPPMPSISDLDDLSAFPSDQLFEPPSHSQPFPPRRRPSRTRTQSQSFVSAPRGRQQQPSRQQQQQMRHIQELYDRSQTSPSPSGVMPPGSGRTKPGFKQEVVRSSIPTVLGKQEEEEQETAYVPAKEDLSADPVPVKISWIGGGKEVILARAGDDDWKGRSPMNKEPGNIWSLTVYLQPGTHHVRFLVDGQWRVADDLPAAVDDQGSLANYVAVPLTFGPSGHQILPSVPQIPQSIPLPTPTRRVVPGQSFWSTDSSADGEDIDTSVRNLHTTSPREKEKDRFAAAYIQARWTNVLPPELIEAAREEEIYLAASAGQYDHTTGTTTKITGFVPAPNIPPAPGLPRHLDKLILNSRVGEQKSKGEGSVNGSNSGTTTPAGGTSGVGSGQASSSRRERRERERDRDRDRDRDRPRDKNRGDRDREKRDRDKDKDRNRTSRRVDYPPPPPPSTVDVDEFPMPRVPVNSTVSLPVERSSYSYGSYNETTIATVPEAGPFVPFGEIAPDNNNSDGTLRGGNNQNGSGSTVGPGGNLGGSNGSGGGSTPVNSPGTPTGHTPPTSSLVGLTGTGPIPPHIAKQLGTKFIGTSSPPPTSSLSPPSQPLLERTPVSGSRAITIDTANMPSLTDDGSVLPVPSHVVLHHLCTSAIRNGVLAVANTTRYKKKYLTTIYYKPTSMA